MDPCISTLSEYVLKIAKDEFLMSIYSPLDQELPSKEQYNANTESTEKKIGTISWSEPLQQLVYDESYLIGVVNDALKVRIFDAPLYGCKIIRIY